MKRTFALAIGCMILLSGPAFAACIRAGSQVDCRWPGVLLRLGTQSEANARASGLGPHAQGFAGPATLGREAPVTGTLVMNVQRYGDDPRSCTRLGNETYCW
jgi:hypothetical protein